MNAIALFMKPWKSLTLPQAVEKAHAFGVNAVEIPARPGFWLTHDSPAQQAQEVSAAFNAHGIAIAAISAEPTETALRLAATITPHPLVRFMIPVPEGQSYLAIEKQWITRLAALLPLAEDLGVTLGLQNHDQRFVANAAGVLRILEPLRSRHIGAVWDPAHCAFAGEIPEHALDLLSSHLLMVNVKNGCYLAEADSTESHTCWRRHWTTMRHGLVDWERVVGLLTERQYAGPYCIFAEFSEGHLLERHTTDDIAYLRQLLDRSDPR
jgi:sugar phosphate isomerase/epimerase